MNSLTSTWIRRASRFRPKWNPPQAPPASMANRAPIRAGIVSPRRVVPAHIPRPPYVVMGRVPDPPHEIEIKSRAQIEKMRRSCALAASVLTYASALVAPGVTTDYIDAMVHDRIVASGAFPSPLGYKGYPKSICTSVNEVMCHGIPDNRALLAGDIVNVDATVFLDGYHGDTSATFFVGGPEQCSTIARDLVQATEEALAAGIELCAPGRRFHEIGNRIHKVVNGRFGISEIFVGHGIGSYFHGPPYIFHHANHYGRSIVGGEEMRPGMTFTIEPILTEKSPKDKLWSDGWTAVTRDGGLSAQCEHTVLITETGVEVLTARQPSAGNNTTLSSSAAQGS